MPCGIVEALVQRTFLMPLLALSALSLCAPSPASAAATSVQFSQTMATFGNCDSPITTVDVNNDGRPDILSGSFCTSDQPAVFNVRLATGNGTYSTAEQSYSLPNVSGNAIYGVFTGDFNNDGWADVGIASSAATYLYLNDGKGNLVLTTTLNVIPDSSVVTSDFNHDGNMDIAYITSGELYIQFGNGAGGFTAGPVTAVNYDVGPPLLTGDFDGDSNADLAIADTINYTSPTVLYGDSTGHFVPKALTTQAGYLDVGDVNSDGRTDLIVVPYDPTQPDEIDRYLAVYYGNTARSFANNTTIPTTGCPEWTTVGDLDGNGLNDLVVDETVCSGTALSNGEYLGVRTRNSNSSYNSERIVFTMSTQYGGSALGPWLVNADKNSKPDIVTGVCADDQCQATNYYTLLNTTKGNFPTCAPPNSFEGINVCSPAGASASSPVAFHLSAAGQVPMRKMEVWVDGTKKAEELNGFSNLTFLDTKLKLSPGKHQVTIFGAGWDNWLEKQTLTLKVK